MELLAIVRTMWRHRVLSLSVLGLTFLGLIYVVFLTPREYETTSSTVLFPAAAPPTAEEIQEDPSLAGVASNPFSLFGDPSVIIDVVARRLSTESAREALSAAGADDRYEIGASVRYGSTRPFVDVVAIGDNPNAASRTIEVVQTAVETELQKVQEEQGVDPRFMIKSFVVDPGEKPVLVVSGVLRPAVAVLGLGGIALFVMLSVAVALDHRRAERPVIAGSPVEAEPTPLNGSKSQTEIVLAATSSPRSAAARPASTEPDDLAATSNPRSAAARPASTEPDDLAATSNPRSAAARPASTEPDDLAATSNPRSAAARPASTEPDDLAATSNPRSAAARPASTEPDDLAATSNPRSAAARPASTEPDDLAATSNPRSAAARPASTEPDGSSLVQEYDPTENTAYSWGKHY